MQKVLPWNKEIYFVDKRRLVSLKLALETFFYSKYPFIIIKSRGLLMYKSTAHLTPRLNNQPQSFLFFFGIYVPFNSNPFKKSY